MDLQQFAKISRLERPGLCQTGWVGKPTARGESFGNHEVESYSYSSRWLFFDVWCGQTIASHHLKMRLYAHLKFRFVELFKFTFLGSCMLLIGPARAHEVLWKPSAITVRCQDWPCCSVQHERCRFCCPVGCCSWSLRGERDRHADRKSIQIIGAHCSACVCIVFVVSKHLICICFFAGLTCIRFMVSAF